MKYRKAKPQTASEAILVRGIYQDAKALFAGLLRLHGSSVAQDADLYWALHKYLAERGMLGEEMKFKGDGR